ncbi:hypothetical protein GCM10008960_27820 [Deinococcus sedimenti]|uniref:Secreted protein n=1 Tax=Deinococcus sedimenti TaxID=1867090 RepID=A0ABQ2S5J7_9DEIO|nr:hypothetical protein GCM10008960_27820 [Deinococcus sedimenti]
MITVPAAVPAACAVLAARAIRAVRVQCFFMCFLREGAGGGYLTFTRKLNFSVSSGFMLVRVQRTLV